MKTQVEIEDKISELEWEIENLLVKQRDSVFTTAVASLQEIINIKKSIILELKWVINK